MTAVLLCLLAVLGFSPEGAALPAPRTVVSRAVDTLGGRGALEAMFGIRDVVRRYGLNVEHAFGMQVGPAGWSEIEAAIGAAARTNGKDAERASSFFCAAAPPGR